MIIQDLNAVCKYPPLIIHTSYIIIYLQSNEVTVWSHLRAIGFYYSTTAYGAIKITHMFWNSAHRSFHHLFRLNVLPELSELLFFLNSTTVVRHFKQVPSASAINVTKQRQNILVLTQGLWDEVAKFFFCFTVGVCLSHLKKVWGEIPQRCTLTRKRHVASASSELESTCEIISSSKREHDRLPLTMLSHITSELWMIACSPNVGCGAILLPQKLIYFCAYYIPTNYTTVQSSILKKFWRLSVKSDG